VGAGRALLDGLLLNEMLLRPNRPVADAFHEFRKADACGFRGLGE